MTQEITYTKRLAPEDLVPGRYIAIAAKIHEFLRFSGCFPGATIEKVPVTCIECADGEPRRILAVCIPFVMTEDARGRVEILDVRQHILVHVDEMYALEKFTRPSTKCRCGEE